MKKFIILLVSVICLTSSCDRPLREDEDIRRVRYTPKLELRQMMNSSEVESESRGSFFVFMGSHSSETSTEEYVKVFVKTDTIFRFVKLNLEKVRIQINDSVKIPTLQLKYYSNYETPRELFNYLDWCRCEFYLTVPEKYLPEKLYPIELGK